MSGLPPQAQAHAQAQAQAQVEDDAEVVAPSLEQPELFARLYDRYAPDIHRYVARRLGDGIADDLTTDTFLTAFRIRGRYDRTRADARPWLYGIAGNLIGKHRRTEVRALRAPAPPNEGGPSHGGGRAARCRMSVKCPAPETAASWVGPYRPRTVRLPS